MHKRNLLSVGTWVGITLVLWIIAWVIAEAIPVFNDLLSLIVRFIEYHIQTEANRAPRLLCSLVGLLVSAPSCY